MRYNKFSQYQSVNDKRHSCKAEIERFPFEKGFVKGVSDYKNVKKKR